MPGSKCVHHKTVYESFVHVSIIIIMLFDGIFYATSL